MVGGMGAAHGALVTETPLKVAPQRGMFHSRNRLISGLAQAVVIVEANDRLLIGFDPAEFESLR